jgi:hypothetical protein
VTDITPLIERIAARLGQIDGVVAVVLGGSRARGAARRDSDIDLGIYYRPAHCPSLRALAQELDDRHPTDAVTDYGEWGPWINGGAWLVIDGHHVDWLFRDLDRVQRTIAACRAGEPTCDYQVGHPHGFHNHIYMGEVHHCRLLHDPNGTLATLQQATAEYPVPLKRALINRYLFEAHFSLFIARKAVDGGDTFYVAGCLFRGVACLVQVLFALNERYFVNEKGAVAAIDGCALRPAGFGASVAAMLGQTGADAGQLRASLQQLGALIDAVQQLCGEWVTPNFGTLPA